MSHRIARWLSRIGLLALVLSLGVFSSPAQPAAAAGFSASANVSGSLMELPGGSLGLAMGVEHRDYFGRFDPDPTAPFSDHEDPGLTGMTAPLTSAIVTHLWQTLNWKVPDQRYNLLNGSVNGNWRWNRGRGQAESFSALRHALALDGNLQALVVHGFTDLVTPYFASELLLRQLPPNLGERAKLAVYSGGHMFYTRDASRAAFREDGLKMMRAATEARQGERVGP